MAIHANASMIRLRPVSPQTFALGWLPQFKLPRRASLDPPKPEAIMLAYAPVRPLKQAYILTYYDPVVIGPQL